VPKLLPALATRAGVVAVSATAAAVFAALPPAAEPAAPVATISTAEIAEIATVAHSSDASASASKAVSVAKSKLGARYRYGAAGPSAFDCSGLVNYAFKSAGISLPRTARQLSKVGRTVSKSELRPGDLVFFYKPISHVGIYVGGGKIVHASNKRSPVKYGSVDRMVLAKRVA
jgi:peptidoglycan DL-endopeptidase CwlO